MSGTMQPLAVIDATVIDDPANADEMLAWCLNYATDGDEIRLHGNWCRTNLGALERCTCKSILLVVGAKA